MQVKMTGFDTYLFIKNISHNIQWILLYNIQLISIAQYTINICPVIVNNSSTRVVIEVAFTGFSKKWHSNNNSF